MLFRSDKGEEPLTEAPESMENLEPEVLEELEESETPEDVMPEKTEDVFAFEERVSPEDAEEDVFEDVEEIEETVLPGEDSAGKTMVYTSPKEAGAKDASEEEKIEEVIYRPEDYRVPDADRLSLRMTDAIDFDTDDEKLREKIGRAHV